MTSPSLRRSAKAPTVRIVHLGLGAFSRSHTAWYTQRSVDGADWGIAAYTGRSRNLPDRLNAQFGVYTLVERDSDGDRPSVVSSVVRAHPGDDLPALMHDLAAPDTAVVTLTITEVGYRLTPSDEPDLDDPSVRADIAGLSAIATGDLALADARPTTAMGRLLLGFEARRRAGGGPLAVLSCDNLPDNGGRLRRGMSSWARNTAPELHRWIMANVAFASSSVDRITPRISDAEEDALRVRFDDLAPVVAEPFSDWVISGEFPAGRPDWESAGARFVDELEPWEARKLWLLNGAHTLLACQGLRRGHATVADAIADPACRAAVDALWDEAESALPDGLDIPAYRDALLSRFENPRIEHRLEQIARDTTTKVRLRIAPVAERERSLDRSAAACAFAFACWIFATEAGMLPSEERPTEARPTKDWVGAVSPALADDADFVHEVERAVHTLANNETATVV
ncbi:mannitol dehydrogenase family protein [Microbacterium hatanonis]|uniref:Mannitol-1-phosphate 5-dehydrogenase n=1 Tax=Microbacterium hatanonis TaxID=404366 RepID=A0A5C8HUQ8_9MICO|nr:mannitol dehydrogenase family protein [Microbacterium hatanonis]TXK09667.1 mannitol dehydrogenase family protein [Microbacterium hatanonis]